METPVLFLVFNRPKHTKAALERLRRVRPSQLFIHADGPRPQRSGEEKLVAEVRDELKKIDWPCEVKTLFREKNWGLREGVFDALNWFFGQVEQGIIMEDDCIPDESFFRFCSEMLAQFADNEQVMHIGGSNLAEGFCQKNFPGQSYFFTQFGLVWGWASWRRAWQKMDLNLKGLEGFECSEIAKNWVLNKPAKIYMLDKFWTTKRRENQSWAYAWQYSLLKTNGLCILPAKNLVQNVGVGEAEATNTSGENPKARLRAGKLDFPLAFPQGIGFRVPEKPLFAKLESEIFYVYQKNRFALWRWLFLKKMGIR